MSAQQELLVERDGARVRLLSPGVGLFTEARAPGALLAPREAAGVLLVLGRPLRLVVPAEVTGRVVGPGFERRQAAVGFGDVLYELEQLATGAARAAPAAASSTAQAARGLVLRSPQSGRFYQRPAPGEPVFLAPGAVVQDGQPIGLIEVMKTFTHVVYRAGDGLPARARLVRYAAADGAEVRSGAALLELEPA